MRNGWLIFRRQLQDTPKNRTVLIQFVLFPALTLLMNSAVKIEGMPKNFFVTLFATMYVGMAPLTATAAIIAEEKEKNTLRVLMFSGVRPQEYLAGVGGYVLLLCMAGAGVLCAAGEYTAPQRTGFLAVMAAGILVSILLGGAIGVASPSQMTATSVTVPVMLLLAFAPMLSIFNARVDAVAQYLYSGQVSRMLADGAKGVGVLIFAANLLAAAGLFAAAYKRSKLA